MSAPRVDEQLLRELDFGAVLTDSLRILFRLSPHFALAALLPFALASVFCACACCGSAVLVGVLSPANAHDDGRMVGQVLLVLSLLLYALLSFLPIAIQTVLVVGEERGARPTFFAALRSLPRRVPVFVPIALLVGAAFAFGSAFCLVPGVIALGLLGFAPAFALEAGTTFAEALSGSTALADAVGMRAYVPGVLHAVLQVLVFALFTAATVVLERHFDGDTPLAFAVAGIIALLGWLVFTYGVVVVPAVLYARMTRVPGAAADDLAEVFA